MQKNSLLIIVAICLIGATMWFLKSANDLKKNLVPIVQQIDIPPQSSSEAVVISMPRDLGGSRAEESAAQRLEERLVVERERLEIQQQTLLALQRQQAALPPVEGYSMQIDLQQSQIQDLNSLLEEYRYEEARLDERARLTLQAATTSAQLAQSQIDEDIRLYDQSMKQAQAEMNEWKRNSNYVNAQQTRMAELQESLQNQQSQLEQLQAQRSLLSVNTLQQTSDVRAATIQTREELMSRQDEIQNEISSLRDELRRLREASTQVRMSRMSLGTQILEAQKNIETRRQVLQSLESQLRSQSLQ